MSEVIHLNFDWAYCDDFRDSYIKNDCNLENFTLINIPHCNVELPYNNFDEKKYQIESCYKKTLHVPKDKEGKRVFLNFGGVMTYAKVYVNESYVMEHKGGYTPFRADLTEYINYGKDNYITVYVDSRERDEIPPFGFVIDYLTYGGIYREVYLEYTENILMEYCHVKTKRVLDYEKLLDIDIYLENYLGVQNEAKIIGKLKEDDNEIKKFRQIIELTGDNKQKINIVKTVKNVELWDIDNPNLYNIELILEVDGEIKGKKIIRFGFRDAKFLPNGFYLNGSKLKLRGLNRHQSFPYVGYAMPKSAQYKDAQILKYDLGLNIVRLSHYPQSDHFLDRCDEIGLLVFDEIPGWQHLGEKGEWWDIAKANTEEMIKKDWNRPSVIIWGTRINESEDCDELYTETNRIAKELDDTRATTGVRCIGGSNLIEDVYSYNDFLYDGNRPALDKKKNIVKDNVPYIITEYNGHMFSTKKYDNVQRRIEHALRHLRVLDAMYKDNEVAGAIGWCMADYNTHKEFGSGDKICYHGVLDMFRIEKYAASAYSSQQDNYPVMAVAQALANGDMDNSTRGNVYIFTNCDYVKLYIGDKYIKEFYPRKDLFKNVVHSPVLIDDFLGDAIKENEIFNNKDSDRIKKLLIKANEVGEDLPLHNKLMLGYLFFKYKIDMKDGRDLYTKYFGGWGSSSSSYTFEGYKNDKCVITKTKSQVSKPKLHMDIDSDILTEDITYDVTRVVIRLKDDYNEDIIYAHDVITVETDDKLEVIGPKILSLIGGSIGFWVKTVGIEGEGQIKVNSQRFGEIVRTVYIRKIG